MAVNIIKTYRINHYNRDMYKLYVDLRDHMKNQFPTGIVLQPNDRIIFLNDDLDFYINNKCPGFSLYNIQLILSHLDISNFFCAVISNIPNYKFYTDTIRDMLRPGDVPLRGITSLSTSIVPTITSSVTNNVDLNSKQIRYPFISLSRLSRFHRTFFMAKLFERNLQNKGLVTYHNRPTEKDGNCYHTHDQPLQSVNTSFSFLYPTPFTQYNHNEIHLLDESNRDLVVKFNNKVTHYSNFQDDTDINDKLISGYMQSAPTQQALAYIGIESAAIYPEPFLSQISFKGIATKRPFIILGVPGTIKYLQDLGFKTFNKWWDESYDLESDFETRTDMIISLIDQISNYSVSRLQEICVEMDETLQHNYQHLTSTFADQEAKKNRSNFKPADYINNGS